MLQPSNRSSVVRRNLQPLILIILSIIVVLTIVLLVAFRWFSSAPETTQQNDKQISLTDVEQLWNQKDYKQLIDKTSLSLRINPFQFELLLYRGFSHYYFGVNQENVDDRTISLMKCIADLRRAMVLEPYRNNSDIDYILGKSYFAMGYFYHDLARAYILKASANPSMPDDVNEFLGVLYSNLGNASEAINYFNRSLQKKDNDTVKLALAAAYVSTDDLSNATKQIEALIIGSKDPLVVQKARFLRADLLLREQKIDDALKEYLTIVTDDADSADAHFNIGEIYAEKGDMLKARVEWRAAYNLDPKHSGAINRLNSNSQ